MLSRAKVVLLAVMLTSGCSLSSVTGLSGGEVARVGTVPIDRGAWRQAQESALGTAVLQELVDEVVILAAGRREGVVPPEAEIDKEFKKIRTWYGSEEAFQKALKSAELTVIDIRRKLTLDLTLEALALARVKITPEELIRYFETNREEFGYPGAVRVRHIAVASQDEAAQVLARLGRRESFAEIARTMSTDLETRDSGGDFGWFSPKVPFVRGLISLTGEPFPAPGFGPSTERVRLIASMPEMRAGEILGPIPSPYGLSFVQLVETRPAIIPDFEEVIDQVASKYFRVTNHLSTRSLLWELRQSINYEISRPNYSKLGHRSITPSWQFSPQLMNAVDPSSEATVPGLVDTLKVFLHSYLSQDYDGLRLISKSLFWSQVMATEGQMRPRHDRMVKTATFMFVSSDGISKFTVSLQSIYVAGGVEKQFNAELEVDAFAVAGGTEWKVVRLTEKGGG